MNCPACGYYNPPASVACAHCAAPLLASVGEALCAVHHGVQALGTCSRCGTFGCGVCLEQRDAGWQCTACRQLSSLPWDDRETLGVWRAWWRTSVRMISAPYQTLRSAQPDAPLGSSIFFAMLSAIVGLTPTMLFAAPYSWFVNRAGAGDDLASAQLGRAIGSVLGVLLAVAFMLAYHLGALFIFSALEHLALAAVGGQPKSFSVTVRAHALAMGCYLIGLFPLCSFYVYPVWAMVLRVFGMNVLHRTTPGRATAAVLLPVGLLCGGALALYAAVIALAMSFAR